MRTFVTALALVTLLGSAQAATAAPITYNVNLIGPSETVQGFITTDGVIGDINGHILSWAFTGSGNVAFTMSSATDGVIDVFGPVLSASLTDLTLLAPSGIGGDNQQMFFRPSPGNCGKPTFYFERVGTYVGAAYASDPCNAGGTFGEVFRSSDAVVVGSAPPLTSAEVPEPASMLLIGTGLVALAAGRYRRRAA